MKLNRKIRKNKKRGKALNTNRNKAKYFTKEEMFLSRMASILMKPIDYTKAIFSQRTITVIRINNLAEDPKRITDALRKYNIEIITVPWSPNTYIINNFDKSDLGETDEYKKGLFYIQNLSSILPIVELDPQKNDVILDMCAAPGSKTSLICSITDNNAEITANEEDYRRLSKLQNVLNQFHCRNVTLTQKDGRAFGNIYPDHFDKVLLDAPCSGEGLIYLRGEKPLRFWSIKKIKYLSRIQKGLLVSAFDSLRAGGTLIYSTCTLEPEENEGVISYLLDERKNASIENIDLIENDTFKDYSKYIVPGIKKWSGKTYDRDVRKAIRIIPSSEMQGFFIAKITKEKI